MSYYNKMVYLTASVLALFAVLSVGCSFSKRGEDLGDELLYRIDDGIGVIEDKVDKMEKLEKENRKERKKVRELLKEMGEELKERNKDKGDGLPHVGCLFEKECVDMLSEAEVALLKEKWRAGLFRRYDRMKLEYP